MLLSNINSLYQPVSKGSFLSREIGCNKEDCAFIGGEGSVISFFMNLPHGILGIPVNLELEDIYEPVGEYLHITPSGGRVHLGPDIETEHLRRDRHHVLEMNLLVPLLFRRDVGEQRLQAPHEILGSSTDEVIRKNAHVEVAATAPCPEEMVL